MTDARIHLSGNIGPGRSKDGPAIDIQASGSGLMYARFAVATTERKRNQDGSYSDGDTSWWNCTAFGNTAEMVAENLDKGFPVILDGKVKIRKYEQNGEQRIAVDVTVDSIGLDLSRAKRQDRSRQQAPSFDPDSVPF